MFERSRRRIVAAIMSVLTLLWLGTLLVIYASSYVEVTRTNRELLREHAERFELEMPIEGISPPIKPFPGREPRLDTRRFKLSTFYTVALGYDGAVLEVRSDKGSVYADSELETAALLALDKPEAEGGIEGLIYYRLDKGGYILVAFMDNTIIGEGMSTLFRYTLIYGSVAIVLLFLLAVYLARRIVAPLEAGYKKQKQFISDAGHELKTPVAVVGANAELLRRELGDNRWLANIEYENARMGELVAELLELARTEDIKPPMERLNLSRLTAGAALPFESLAYDRGKALEMELAPDVSISGNAAELTRLVSILVDNAIAHGTGGEPIGISLTPLRGFAVLRVTNAADALPPEQLSHLFERFYRVSEARSGEDRHYGLGLPIAKAIVEAHGGKIDAAYENGRMCVTVKLPLSS